jgi:hypothetical protein
MHLRLLRVPQRLVLKCLQHLAARKGWLFLLQRLQEPLRFLLPQH